MPRDLQHLSPAFFAVPVSCIRKVTTETGKGSQPAAGASGVGAMSASGGDGDGSAGAASSGKDLLVVLHTKDGRVLRFGFSEQYRDRVRMCTLCC